MPELRQPRGRDDEHDPLDVVGDALMGALADVDVQLRNEFPALFERVDAIKAEPGWEAFAKQKGTTSTSMPEADRLAKKRRQQRKRRAWDRARKREERLARKGQ